MIVQNIKQLKWQKGNTGITTTNININNDSKNTVYNGFIKLSNNVFILMWLFLRDIFLLFFKIIIQFCSGKLWPIFMLSGKQIQ